MLCTEGLKADVIHKMFVGRCSVRNICYDDVGHKVFDGKYGAQNDCQSIWCT